MLAVHLLDYLHRIVRIRMKKTKTTTMMMTMTAMVAKVKINRHLKLIQMLQRK
jgi:hypothetical protein